jgi:hypothetical protein
MKYGNRSLWKRLISSPFTLAAFFIIFGLLTKATWSVHQKAQVSYERLEQAENSLLKLQARNDELSQKVSYLSTEEGIKSEIRNKFRVAEEGESIAVIIDNNELATTSATTTVPQISWWSRMWKFLW